MIVYIKMLRSITGKDVEEEDVSAKAERSQKWFQYSSIGIMILSAVLLGVAIILWPRFEETHMTISFVTALYQTLIFLIVWFAVVILALSLLKTINKFAGNIFKKE